MSADTLINLVGVAYVVSFFASRRYLRRRNLVRQRPAWQVYLMFSFGGILTGMLYALAEDLLF